MEKSNGFNNFFVKHKKVILVSIGLFYGLLVPALIAITVIFGLNLNNQDNSSLASNNQPTSGLNTINFNMELFIFITMIVIIGIVGLATIGVCIMVIILYYQRNKPVVAQYDTIKTIDSVDEVIDNTNQSSGLNKALNSGKEGN